MSGLRQTWYSWSCPSSMNGLKYSSGASAFQATDAWLAANKYQQKLRSSILEQRQNFMYWLSLFACQDLENSKVLKRIWRICYLKEAKDPWLSCSISIFSILDQTVLTLAETCFKEFSPRILAAFSCSFLMPVCVHDFAEVLLRSWTKACSYKASHFTFWSKTLTWRRDNAFEWFRLALALQILQAILICGVRDSFGILWTNLWHAYMDTVTEILQ